MIQDTYTGSGKFTLAPSSLPPIPAFFIAFPTAAKRSLKKEMISCSKQPQTFSLHLSMVLSTCVSHVLYYLPAARFQNTRIFFMNFILFEPRWEIWTQLRNKQEKACSHLCYVNLLALIVCRIFSDFEHYSNNKKCYCYEWKRLCSVGVAVTIRFSCFRFNRVSQ